VVASGAGTVSVKPDLVRVTVGVTTQASNAQDASTQNATVVQNVLDKLKQGFASAEIRTLNYSLSPNYTYPPGQSPNLTGFTATNSIQVSTSDLSAAGRIIDTATQAGANRIDSLSFYLKDDAAARAQALRMAAAEARTQADAIAAGLSLKLGAVIVAQQGVSVVPVSGDVRAGAGTAATTPVQSGNVEVRASVTVQVEIL
jgi:uncharacterized protein YggE